MNPQPSIRCLANKQQLPGLLSVFGSGLCFYLATAQEGSYDCGDSADCPLVINEKKLKEKGHERKNAFFGLPSLARIIKPNLKMASNFPGQ